MNQEIVEKILTLEKSAELIVNKATEKAKAVVASAEKEAADTRAEILAEAQKQVDHIKSKTHDDVIAHRATVMQQAENQANDEQMKAAKHIADAVTYIVDRVKPTI
ncbi:MAG: hypothetical protein P1S60_10655 [Anaerolineae bacterium]|nr:hypothetical protein [Anaerolineae bacterium]